MEGYIEKLCPVCKTELREADAVKVCPDCASVYHEACWDEYKGCTVCGSEARPVETVDPNPAVVCVKCATLLREDQAFCPQCGTPRDGKVKSFCNQCGMELQAGQMFCPMCGQKAEALPDLGERTVSNPYKPVIQQKKKNMLPLIAILCVAAVAVVGLFVLLLGPSVDEIELEESSIELMVDDSITIDYSISPGDAGDVKVTWESSDESVATVNSKGKITAEGEGTCTITVKAGGKSDKLKVKVTDGPDFRSLYNKYCEPTWAEYGSDGSYLFIDTNPDDWDDDGLAYVDAYFAVENVNNALGLPDSLFKAMGETTGADGKQTEVFGNITVSWKYHPDKGLEVTYKLN